jgi:hypothetical protein
MRRYWVIASLAAAFAVALAGCGGDDDTKASPTTFPTSSDPAGKVPEDVRTDLNVVLAVSDLVVGENNLAFGLTDKDDEPVRLTDAKATFFFQTDGTNWTAVESADAILSAPGVGEVVEHTHTNGEQHEHGGEDDNRVVYFVPVSFHKAGPWGMVVQATLPDGTKAESNVGFLVQEKSELLVPGDQAHASDNLTKADVDDIKTIDSGDPPNDMHDIKIKDALATGRPLLVVFSTPAYCLSRFCGPVTEEMDILHDAYKDSVDFVHIEVWFDFNQQELNPTAAEWLQRSDGGLSEPWVYLVGKDGIVYDRWEGAASAAVVEPELKAVAEGATWAPR